MSNQTLIPTHGLRFLRKDVPVADRPGLAMKANVLQQLFCKPNGQHIWRDVPLVEQEDTPSATDHD